MGLKILEFFFSHICNILTCGVRGLLTKNNGNELDYLTCCGNIATVSGRDAYRKWGKALPGTPTSAQTSVSIATAKVQTGKNSRKIKIETNFANIQQTDKQRTFYMRACLQKNQSVLGHENRRASDVIRMLLYGKKVFHIILLHAWPTYVYV